MTQKALLLQEHTLRQHAGWGMTSRMPAKYIHFFWLGVKRNLLEAYGIVKREKTLVEILKPKECPSCREPNKTDAKFCSKCRMVLNYEAFDEIKMNEQLKTKEAEETKARVEEIYQALYKQGIIKKE